MGSSFSGAKDLGTGIATGGHVPTLPRPRWVVRFAQIGRVLLDEWGGGSRLHEPESTPYILEHITKMRLSTADCIYISGFWWRSPHTSTGALLLGPAGGLPSPKLPVPTLPPNPGYADGSRYGKVQILIVVGHHLRRIDYVISKHHNIYEVKHFNKIINV